MCRYQDTQGFHQDKTQKLFCTGTGMQFLNLAQTYSIVRRKAEDDDHILHLPHNKTTVLQLAKFLPIILVAKERRGIKGKPHVYVTIINSYGLSVTDRMIREAVLSIQGGKEYADGRLYNTLHTALPPSAGKFVKIKSMFELCTISRLKVGKAEDLMNEVPPRRVGSRVVHGNINFGILRDPLNFLFPMDPNRPY